MAWLTLIGIALVLIYIVVMVIRIGAIPESISETYYKGGGAWFTITLLATSVLITAGLLSLHGNVLSFVVGASIGFIGASPHFHEECCRKMHYGNAVVLTVASQWWIWLYCSHWVFLLWIPAVWWGRRKEWTFWAEVTMMVMLGSGVVVNY